MSRPLILSFLLPLLALAQDSSSASELPPPGYNGGSDNPQDPSDAGAAGSQKGAFSLSGGAIAAIIVVAVIVVLGSSTFYKSCLEIRGLTSTQSHRVYSGGSRRSASGTFEHLFAAPRAASPAARRPTLASRTVRTEEQESDSTRHPRERMPTRCAISRRVFLCPTRRHRLQLQLRA
jgi:hypothetical protein